MTGTTNHSVTWRVQEGGAGGTVTPQGVYTAPATPGEYHVVATSVADTSKSAVATALVYTPGSLDFNGRVVDAKTDRGVPQAQVSLSPAGKTGGRSRQARETTTNAEGYYELVDVQCGKQWLRIALPDGTYRSIEVELELPCDRPTASIGVRLVPGDASEPTTITIQPQTPTVAQGEVVQFFAQVGPDADVKPFFVVHGPGGTVTIDGLFTAVQSQAPGDEATVVIAQAGNVKTETTVTVTGPVGGVSGTVKDFLTGKPVADATVTVGGKTGTTDASGAFLVANVPAGHQALTITKTDYDAKTEQVAVTARAVAHVGSLYLKPTGTEAPEAPVM